MAGTPAPSTTPGPSPLGLAVGPAGVAEIGRAPAARSGGRPIGDPGEPGMWYPFGDDDPDAWIRFGDLLRRLQGS
ncbi:DUF6177 family protein [Actinomadura sp. 3N407]|uniref:DUF6177 family protein n=1 Tax=Actinomadura sp. 3N407 TaxID=3457423 RepID=UPI003FCCB121